MRTTSLLLLLAGFFYFAHSQESDKGCVGHFKCCKFTEVNGIVTCTQECEPKVACEPTELKQEVVEEKIEATIAFAAFVPVSACREGFRPDGRGDKKFNFLNIS